MEVAEEPTTNGSASSKTGAPKSKLKASRLSGRGEDEDSDSEQFAGEAPVRGNSRRMVGHSSRCAFHAFALMGWCGGDFIRLHLWSQVFAMPKRAPMDSAACSAHDLEKSSRLCLFFNPGNGCLHVCSSILWVCRKSTKRKKAVRVLLVN